MVVLKNHQIIANHSIYCFLMIEASHNSNDIKAHK